MPDILTTSTAAPRRVLPQTGGAANPPPFTLIAAHFGASLGWLLVASVLLVWLSPRLAAGRIFDPPVLAMVHMLTLGVLASAVFGALNQFVPGGLGVPLRSVRVARAGFWMLQTGVILLTVGLWAWRGALQGLGWMLVFGATGAVSYNTLRARRVSVHGRQIGLFLTIAHSSLGAGMLVALARIGETLGWWHVERLSLLAAHTLLGVVGFGTLSAVGVASRMLPTFLLGPGDDTRELNRQLFVTVIGLCLFVGGALFSNGAVMRAGGAVIVAAGVLTVLLGIRWFRRRQRAIDASLAHVGVAFGMLALATLGGAWLVLAEAYDFARWSALLVLLMAGWLVTMVIGVMSKIFTHLAYNNLARVMPGFRALGQPSLLLQREWQRASCALLAVGVTGLAASLVAHSDTLAQVFATVWAGGSAMTVANYVRMLVRGRWPSTASGRL
jgi:hypothetical protein